MDMPFLKKRYHTNFMDMIFASLLQVSASDTNKKGRAIAGLAYTIKFSNDQMLSFAYLPRDNG